MNQDTVEKPQPPKTVEQRRSLTDADIVVRRDLEPRNTHPRVVANGQNQQNDQNN